MQNQAQAGANQAQTGPNGPQAGLNGPYTNSKALVLVSMRALAGGKNLFFFLGATSTATLDARSSVYRLIFVTLQLFTKARAKRIIKVINQLGCQ